MTGRPRPARRSRPTPTAPASAAWSVPSGHRATAREVELKYRLADADLADNLLARPRFGPFAADERVDTVETDDRFLDTPDGAFAAIEHAVRLRTSGGATIVTLKGPSTEGPGGSSSRMELEAPAEGDDPRAWPDSPARERVLAISDGNPLTEVARLHQRRRRRLLRAGSTLAELTVDEVEVRDGDLVLEAWVEVEVELLEGDADRLIPLAAALEAAGGLAPSPESKYAAALRALARARPGSPREPKAL